MSALLFILTSTSVFAVDMQSNQYRIQYGNMNIGGKDQTSASYGLSTTLGQTAAQQFTSDGYVVKAGFQYIHSKIPFRFTISNINIALGTLTPNTFSTATTGLIVSFGAAGQYQVTAVEQGPLQTLSGNSIPDTSCDGGANTCSETSAKTWTSTSAYGFGYNMSGTDIPADFTNGNFFRPFPDSTTSETPSVVMSDTNVGVGSSATVTFKVNVSSIQAAGSYQTIVRYTATPSF